MKATEKEEIEIDLPSELNHFLIKDLEKNAMNLPYHKQKEIPQFRFIESVLKKCKEKKPRLFSARECATIDGYLSHSYVQTKKKEFEVLMSYFKKGLVEWERKFVN